MINDEYRHTSLLATLRESWDLGDPFSDRDAAARTFDHLLSRETPRDPASWPDVHPRPVPEWQLTKVQLGQALSPLGKAIGPGIVEHAKQAGLGLPADIANAKGPPTERTTRRRRLRDRGALLPAARRGRGIRATLRAKTSQPALVSLSIQSDTFRRV